MLRRWFGLVAAAALLGFGLLALPHLPARLASHWNAHGQIDGTMPAMVAVLFGPAIVLALWLLALVLPRIDPRARGYIDFQPAYWLIMNAIIVFLALTFVLVLGAGLGWQVNVGRVVPAGVGLLFVVLGRELGNIRPNWFVGIRTPWTLSDERVWRETNRAGGWVFMLTGAAIFLLSLVVPVEALAPIIVAGVLGAALGLAAYSYVLSRRHPHAGQASHLS